MLVPFITSFVKGLDTILHISSRKAMNLLSRYKIGSLFCSSIFSWSNLFMPTCADIPSNRPLKNTIEGEPIGKNSDKNYHKHDSSKYPLELLLFRHFLFFASRTSEKRVYKRQNPTNREVSSLGLHVLDEFRTVNWKNIERELGLLSLV